MQATTKRGREDSESTSGQGIPDSKRPKKTVSEMSEEMQQRADKASHIYAKRIAVVNKRSTATNRAMKREKKANTKLGKARDTYDKAQKACAACDYIDTLVDWVKANGPRFMSSRNVDLCNALAAFADNGHDIGEILDIRPCTATFECKEIRRYTTLHDMIGEHCPDLTTLEGIVDEDGAMLMSSDSGVATWAKGDLPKLISSIEYDVRYSIFECACLCEDKNDCKCGYACNQSCRRCECPCDECTPEGVEPPTIECHEHLCDSDCDSSCSGGVSEDDDGECKCDRYVLAVCTKKADAYVLRLPKTATL